MLNTSPGSRRARASRLAAVALAVGLTALPVTGVAAAAPDARSAGKTTAMSIKGYAFAMPTLNLAVGDSVTWTNLDAAAHDATTTKAPIAFKSPLLKTNESWTYTFTMPGTYEYFCSVHPEMVASIVAAAASAQPARAEKPAATAPKTATAPKNAKDTAAAKATPSKSEAKATSAKSTKDAAPAEAATKAAESAPVTKPAKAPIEKAKPATVEDSAPPAGAETPAQAVALPAVQSVASQDRLDLDTEVLGAGLAIAIVVLSLLILGTRGRHT